LSIIGRFGSRDQSRCDTRREDATASAAAAAAVAVAVAAARIDLDASGCCSFQLGLDRGN